MNARNKFFIILAIILAGAITFYFLSTPRGSAMDLVGTVDANQVIVSPQVRRPHAKLLVDEGSRVNQGDLIAVLDPSELDAQAKAAAATIDSLRSQVAATQATSTATQGSTKSSVSNAEAKLESTRAQLLAGGSDFAAGRKRQPQQASNLPNKACPPIRNACKPKPTSKRNRQWSKRLRIRSPRRKPT